MIRHHIYTYRVHHRDGRTHRKRIFETSAIVAKRKIEAITRKKCTLCDRVAITDLERIIELKPFTGQVLPESVS